MKKHFDPYTCTNDEQLEKADCGTVLGSEYHYTCQWDKVTCKRCLRSKQRLIRCYEKIEEAIVDQMGEMAAMSWEDEG